MRLHGETPLGKEPWFVWHCELCYSPRLLWADDETNQYAELKPGREVGYRDSHFDIKQARKILINVEAHTILINPHEVQDENKISTPSDVAVGV